MFSFTLQSIVELCAIASIWAVALAIAFAIFRSFELLRAERALTLKLRDEAKQSRVHRLLESLAENHGAEEGILQELERELSALGALQRRELIDALRQPTSKGRSAYAAKLLDSSSRPDMAVPAAH